MIHTGDLVEVRGESLVMARHYWRVGGPVFELPARALLLVVEHTAGRLWLVNPVEDWRVDGLLPGEVERVGYVMVDGAGRVRLHFRTMGAHDCLVYRTAEMSQPRARLDVFARWYRFRDQPDPVELDCQEPAQPAASAYRVTWGAVFDPTRPMTRGYAAILAMVLYDFELEDQPDPEAELAPERIRWIEGLLAGLDEEVAYVRGQLRAVGEVAYAGDRAAGS